MRIAIVNWTNRKVGGAEIYLERAIAALQGLGHDLAFWHEVDAPSTRDPIEAQSTLHRISVSEDGFDKARRALEEWKPAVLFVQRVDDVRYEHRLLDIAPAIFFAHDYYGTCISGAKAFKFPVVRPCDHTFGPACLLNYFPRRCGGMNPVTMVTAYTRQSTRLTHLRRYHGVVTLSEHMRREYVKHGFDESSVHCLPAIDPVFAPEFDAATRTSGDALASHAGAQLAYIGRIDYLKGCHLLLEALPAIKAALGKRVVLTVAGDGPDVARCRQIAATVTTDGIDVIFTGWSTRPECAAILARTDVLVVPSLWPEPYGLVGLEARHWAVPVAAFAVGGIPEWLEDGRSGALAPGDPPTKEGLTEAIARCLISPEIRRRTLALAAAPLSGSSLDSHVQALIPILENAAGAPLTIALNDHPTAVAAGR